MTTILQVLKYARINLNRGQGDDLQRRDGIRKLNQAMELLEQGYPLDADVDNLPDLTAPTVVNTEGKEEADMGPKAQTPKGKNSGQTKPSNGTKNQPRPQAKPAKK